MKIKEKIKDDYKYKYIKKFEILNNDPVVTHYLHNINTSRSSFFKEDAVNFLNNHINILNNEENLKLTTKIVLQQMLFDIENVPFSAPSNPSFTFIDLFAGIGGFRLALQNLNGKCVFTSEWDKAAQVTYKINFGDVPFGDITKSEVKKYIPDKFDILCAGFPCQAFSIAGYRKGFSDTRGTLFFEIEQIVEKHRPKVIFLENVKNLQTHDKGKTFKVMLDVLENKLGYAVFHEVLNSMTHANIPQNRERIFIVAFDPNQVKNYKNFKFPERIPRTKTIHHILETEKRDDIYYYTSSHPYYPELKKILKSRDTIYQWRRVYVRENKSNVCPTLTANMGAGGHNVPIILDDFGIRKLTPRECFSFQGYPKKYKLPYSANSKLYMQAGNSVTTTLIERIGKNIMEAL